MSVSLVLTYLGSKGHKTRWVATGIVIVALSCFMRLVPHIAFGPGQDALELTTEYEETYGIKHNSTGTTGMCENQDNHINLFLMCIISGRNVVCYFKGSEKIVSI